MPGRRELTNRCHHLPILPTSLPMRCVVKKGGRAGPRRAYEYYSTLPVQCGTPITLSSQANVLKLDQFPDVFECHCVPPTRLPAILLRLTIHGGRLLEDADHYRFVSMRSPHYESLAEWTQDHFLQ